VQTKENPKKDFKVFIVLYGTYFGELLAGVKNQAVGSISKTLDLYFRKKSVFAKQAVLQPGS